jgi:hypothetical protein
MNNDLSQIEFYFPKGNFNDKEEIVDQIISLMKEKGSTDYSGYADLDLLKHGLLDHIGNGGSLNYESISEDKQKEIESIILNAVRKCNEKLPLPTKNFIFVHPYFPTKEDEVFEGVMAVAVYSCVFHLFINLEQATKKSIENTIAHELNHTIYYYHHYDDFNNYTLLDEILLEGLAENFREQYFKTEITKWAGALEKDEALQIIKNLDKELLKSKDQTVIKGFLFGNEKYKRWTGYSVGYWLVKKFIEENPSVSWDELMRQDIFAFIK